jgi:hypothetical protein
VQSIPPSNTSGWAADGGVNSLLRKVIRTGAQFGSLAPPKVWRLAQRPLVAALRRGHGHRPHLPVEDRRQLIEHFRTDIALLEDLLEREFQDWLGDTGRGTYAVRKSLAPSARDASQ